MSSDGGEPSGLNRRRNRAVFEDESEGDDSQHEPSTPRHPQASAKRQRVDDDSDSESTPTVNGGPSSAPPSAQNGNGHGNGRVNRNGRVNGRGTMNDFQPGAIVRVSVENFVTYEEADFYPGSNLNMVIGPNGTGKSSLVCAICLGLGYPPRVLGRAASIKDFVRIGKDAATIEIELQKRPNDRANYVVKSHFRREQGSTRWWLNGKESNLRTISELCRKLKIQVDNLCQFLPQDRVVEFAGLTPVDRLRETLRAAAPQEVQDWHKELQELHKERKRGAETVHSDKETLENLRKRQAGLQAEVDRVRERQEIQERITTMQDVLVCAKYQEAKEAAKQARLKKHQADAALARFEQEVKPSMEAVEKKEDYVDAIKPAIRARTQTLKNVQLAAHRLSEDVRAAVEQIKGSENEIAAEREGHEKKKKALAKVKSRITSLQADLRDEPPPFDAAAWNQKIRAEEHIARDIALDYERVSAEVQSLRRDGIAKQAEQKNIRAELEALDTQEGQQLALMKKNFPEVAAGWEWISKNQDQFEKQVLGPPMISCSVKDEKFSDHVQSLLQIDDFTCFTTQTKNDYRKLSDQLYRELSLSVVIRTCLTPRSNFRAPVGVEEAQSLGLDGFAIDYLEGPEPVLAMLCAEKKLHMSGVSLNEHGEAEYERLVNHATISTWAAGKQFYAVRRRREYGPGAVTTVAKGILPGRFWTSQPVAAQEKIEAQRRLSEVIGEIEEMKAKIKDLGKNKDDLKNQQSDIEQKVKTLKDEKNEAQTQFTRWRGIPDKISSEEENLRENQEFMAAARKKVAELQQEGDKLVVERAQLVVRHLDAIGEIRDAHRALLEARIRLIEAESDVVGLKERNKHIVEGLAQQREAVQEAASNLDRIRGAARELGVKAQEIVGSDQEKLTLIMSLMQEKTAQDIEEEISADVANLELIHAANPNAVREYEEREAKIAKLTSQIEGRSAKLARLDAQLGELMGKWEPRLDALVTHVNNEFAHNFEQIDCGGEVCIDKAENFEDWALRIKVKFREPEDLQELDAHRQSGGERAVSTIFYLMALQSMAQSPFRVVDEINQGMDPRNERMVHERMVDIACNEHTSQYFLITPKLLTGLRYDARMRVLCIASGEHMPQSGRMLDFRKCLAVQKSLMASAAA